MNSKMKKGKSPKGPVTKEVFPHEMERKKVTGSLKKKPPSSYGARKGASAVKGSESSFMATGTTVKGTPKTKGTKKTPLKAKENLSTNRSKSGILSKSKKMKVRTDREMMKLHNKSASIIQRWWRKILQERNQLRQKLIIAKQALNELNSKRMERKSLKESSVEYSSPAKLEADVQPTGDASNHEGLTTACFGKFNLKAEKSANSSASKSPVKETPRSNVENMESDTYSGCKENKLEDLSNLLRTNPDLLGVTDPTEDDQIEEMLQKVRQDADESFSQKYEPTATDPRVLAALEEDLAAIQKYGDLNFSKPSKLENAEEVTPNIEKSPELIKTERLSEVRASVEKEETPEPAQMRKSKSEQENSPKPEKEDEPSEGSFNEYSLQNEINALAQNLEASISRKFKEEEKDYTEKKISDQREENAITETCDKTAEKAPVEEQKEVKNHRPLEETPSVKLHDETTELDYHKKSEIEFEASSPVKSAILVDDNIDESAKKSKSNFLDFLDTIEERSNYDVKSRHEKSPKNSSPKSNLDKLLKMEEKLGTPSFNGNPEERSHLVSLETELMECYKTIKALKEAKINQDLKHTEELKKLEKECKKDLKKEKKLFEQEKEKHLVYVDELIHQKSQLVERLEQCDQDKVNNDEILQKREKELQERYRIEIAKNKEKWMAGEKVRREKWMKEKTEEIKQSSIKGLEPQLQLMITNHKKQLKREKERYLEEISEEKVRLAEEYEEKLKDFKAKILHDKDYELERMKTRYEEKEAHNYDRIEAQFNKERDRWAENMKAETERIESFRKRDQEIQKEEIISIKKQHQEELLSLKKFYDEKFNKQDNSHSEEILELRQKLREEYNQWKEEFLQKQKDELREKMKEMRDQVKRERNEEVNVIVEKLSSEAYTQEKALITKYERKEKEIENKYRTEILDLKDRVETLVTKNETEKRSKEMLSENMDVLNERMNLNDKEIIEKNGMIESLRETVKSLTNKLNNLQSEEERKRGNFERDEAAKRSHLQKEITYLKDELERQKLLVKAESDKLKRVNEAELEAIEEKVKRVLAKKEETIEHLKEEVAVKKTQMLKYKELLDKQRLDFI